MILKAEQIEKWLYYETGFEQLHPRPPILKWMAEQGYKYNQDWRCTRMVTPTGLIYGLTFPSEEVKIMFMLRWS